MAKKKLNPSIKRSRTRSGCVTCRDRHIKCDEQQPICKNCIKSNRKCYRGIRLNFTQYTFYDPDENKPKNGEDEDQQQQVQFYTQPHLQSPLLSSSLRSNSFPFSSNSQPYQPIRQRHRILDQSITIASLYDDTRNYRPYMHLHSQDDLRESDLQFQEDTYNSYISTSDRKSSSSSKNIAPPSSSLSIIRPRMDGQQFQSLQQQQQQQQQPQQQPQQQQPTLHGPASCPKETCQIMSQLASQNATPFNPDFFTNELYSTNFSTGHLHQQYSLHQSSILPPPQPPPPPTHSLSAPPPSSYSSSSSAFHHNSSLQLPFLPNHHHNHSVSSQHQQHYMPPPPPPPPPQYIQQQLPHQSQQQQQQHQQTSPQSLQHHQSHQFDYPQLSFTQTNVLPLKYDVANYVQLIEHEKYYTLLDLTNEIDIWKSIVPTLCLRISEKDSFLLDCLLSCSRQISPNLAQLTQEQLSKWLQIKDLLVGIENIQLYEHLLISVVLILHGIYLTITRDRLTDFHKIVLNNQAKLFAKILDKLGSFIESNRANNSTVLVNCIYTITILKFYINKNFDLSLEYKSQNNSHHSSTSGHSVSIGITRGTPTISSATATAGTGGGGGGGGSVATILADNSNSSDGPSKDQSSSDDIIYPATYFNADLSNIVNLSQYEIKYLNTCYSVFGYEQVRNESQLYKDLLWYLIKVDTMMNHPENCSDLIIDYNAIHQIDAHSNSMNSNYHPHIPSDDTATRRYSYTQRYYARSFIREFINKLLNMNNSDIIKDANQQLQNLFVQIDESFMDPEIKMQYRHYFTWTLRYIQPINT